MTASPPPPVLLGDRLEHWVDVTPDNDAFAYGERTWTWSELRDRVHRVSGGLRAAGIAYGDRVAFLDKNHQACVEVTLEAAAIGAAHAIINWRLAGDKLDYAINDSGARVLFVGTELVPAIEVIKDRLTSVEKIITVTPDDMCLVMYSSGTTGRPKGVMFTHRNLSRTR